MRLASLLKVNFIVSGFGALLLFLSHNTFSQIRTEEEPNMLYYERTHPRITNFWKMKNFRDVFHKDKYYMGKRRIMGNIAYNFGGVLVDGSAAGQAGERREIRQALSFFTRVRVFEEFYISAVFNKDFNPDAAARWIADYNIAFGRYNWRAHKFNYGYENYTNFKYSDTFRDVMKKLLEGYFFISWNHYSEKVNDWIKIDSTSSLRFIYFGRYALRYRDENEKAFGGLFSGKPTFGAAFRYTILWNLYVESAAYYYILPKWQQPWDPDYSYGFGYFDWRSFRLSITYGNWAINRFPWNDKGHYRNYGFKDGNFRIVANWMW